jgi:hypothetical protein
MSKVAIAGNASGTGVFTIAAPNSNSDRTLDLPDAAGTLDRLNRAGNVLQVVQGKLSTAVAVTATSPVDIGLSASITPASSASKILVFCSIQSTVNATGNGSWAGWYDLLRGSTLIADTSRQWTQSDASGNQAVGGAMTIIWLDSPATTSSTTYKLQAYVGNSSGTMTVNLGSVGESTITLMEIAA